MKKKAEPIVLVTGAKGFLGRHLTALLLARNYKVRITDLSLPDYLLAEKGNDLYEVNINENVFDVFGLSPGPLRREVMFLPADISDSRSEANLRKLMEGVEVVFHLAALFSLEAPFRKLWQVNVEGTKRVLRLAQSAGVKYFINISSGGIYGDKHDTHIITERSSGGIYVNQHELLSDELLINPPENYTLTKWEAEKKVFAANSPDFLVANLRPGNIYGPWGTYGSAEALWYYSVGGGKKVATIPGRRTFSSHVHVVDVARAALFIPENKLFFPHAKERHEVAWNISDAYPTSIEDILEEIDKYLKKKHKIVPLPKRVLEIAAYGYEKLKIKPAVLKRAAVNTLWHDHILSSEKLLHYGFKLKYPNPYIGYLETFLWHEARGWDLFQKKKGGKK